MAVKLQRRVRRAPEGAASVAPVVRRSELTVGRAEDPAERDADQFAAGLLNDLGARPTSLQREAAGVSADRLGGTTVDASIAGRIRSAGGGRPLPDALRRTAEERSGRDLSGVRVHDGAEAADLSASLDARAFTTGSKIFLGAGGGSMDVLAHEVGHVVQQGGGTAGPASGSIGRIRRSTVLAPLQPAGGRTVRRLFGLGKSKGKQQVDGADMNSSPTSVLDENKALIAERDKLRKDIKGVESALAKLSLGARGKGKKKGPSVGSAESAELAAQIQAAALQLLAGMSSSAKGKAGDQMGIFNGEKTRLQQVVDQAQRLVDLHQAELGDRRLVKASKAEAGMKYLQAGQQTADPSRGFGATPFKHLASAQNFGDDAALASGGLSGKRVVDARAAGARLGLSAAEIAAIGVFTRQDYRYMNPAMAASDSWMKAMQPQADDRERAEMHDEGAAHSAMALQGLLRLPAYSGTVYRGTSFKLAEFDQRFFRYDSKTGKRDLISNKSYKDGLELKIEFNSKTETSTFVPRDRTFGFGSLASSSKELGVALYYAKTEGVEDVSVLYELELTNGRDIENLSVYESIGGASEREVALLPGSRFVVESVYWSGMEGHLRVKCRQVK